MALIKCKECGKEISSTAKACIHCGYELPQKELKKDKEEKDFLIVHSYKEALIFNSPVKVYRNGVYLGDLDKGDYKEIGIHGDSSSFVFKFRFSKAYITVKNGSHTKIQLIVNRFKKSVEISVLEANVKR